MFLKNHHCSNWLKCADHSYPFPESNAITAYPWLLCSVRWIELVFFHITTHSVHPPQCGPSSRYLPSHVQRCHFLCNIIVVSSHYMATQQLSCLGDICRDWVDHCIAPEVFVSDSVFPWFALNPFTHLYLGSAMPNVEPNKQCI